MNKNNPDLNDLDGLRSQIDAIDDNIVKLLLERFAVVENVAEYKKARCLEIFQQAREVEVLKKISDKINQTGNQNYKEYILKIYGAILETSKSLQYNKT